MTDLRRTYAPEFETDSSAKIFKVVAAIIVLLVVGAIGAFYLGIGAG